MLFKWPVAKQWEQTFVKGTENLSTDSIVYKQAKSVYLSILILRRKDLCTCIYCYQTCVHESIII